MKFARIWAVKRRILYGTGFLSFLFLIFIFIYFSYFYTPSTCFDGIQNSKESGIDCGGGCVRICTNEILPPKIIWAQSFKIKDGRYNAVAYIDNKNQIAATEKLKYKIELLDGDEVVAERKGTTILPPNSTYPIFEGKIFTKNSRKVTDVKATLYPSNLWVPASIDRTQFKTTNMQLFNSDVSPKLKAIIKNTKLTDARNVEVIATIFNSYGKPVTASRTFIDEIKGDSEKDIVFTWPTPIAKTIRSCIVPTDVAMAIDLSGSMNNDSDNPPQPLTTALKSASEFVNSLKDNDQVSIVSFATNAELLFRLSSNIGEAAALIKNLKIKPEEEVGFTNTESAIKKVGKELKSEKHNSDARRVLVLLTDGLPTAPGDEDIIGATKKAAKSLAESGVDIYAIGLGTNVNQSFIEDLASDKDKSYIAPTKEDLSEIYSDITSSLCEVGPTRIDIIAKTKTNFMPLR